MINLPEEVEKMFIDLAKERDLYIEGNILKLLVDDHPDWKKYLETAAEKDLESRKKRLQLTQQYQEQNKALEEKAKENDKLMQEIKEALEKAEAAKQAAIDDLDVLQKKSQFELIGSIVSYALYVIVGTGIITTGMYVMSILFNSPETTLIGNTWSNLFGILLTNSFSIIGTIMGVKYANSNKEEEKQ